MQKYQNSIQDLKGNAVAGASIAVYIFGTASLATIYSDNGVTVIPPGELLSDAEGEFAFYAANGRYNVQVVATGLASQTTYDVLLFDPADTGISQTTDPGDTGFWPDVTATTKIQRVRDRMFVNDGASFTGNKTGTQSGFVPTSTEGANWASRDSSMFVAQDSGLMAVTGFVSNANLSTASGMPTESIGVSGFAIGNKANRSIWSLYGDIQFTQGNYAFALELAVKNLEGVNRNSTPYVFTTGTYGIWLAGGGDSSYGGAPTNPSNTAIAIGANSSTWNKGILFRADGITGTDGTTGTGTAIEMAKGHQLVWRTPTNYIGFTVRSDATNDTANLTVAAQNNYIGLYGYSGVIAVFQATSSPANYLSLFNSAAASYPAIAASGSDTDIGVFYRAKGTAPHRFFSQDSLSNEEFRAGGVNSAPVNYVHAYGTNASGGRAVLSATGADTNVDMQLVTKGTGVVRFGTHTGTADTAISGYIEIKDASGTVRKLAVIS